MSALVRFTVHPLSFPITLGLAVVSQTNRHPCQLPCNQFPASAISLTDWRIFWPLIRPAIRLIRFGALWKPPRVGPCTRYRASRLTVPAGDGTGGCSMKTTSVTQLCMPWHCIAHLQRTSSVPGSAFPTHFSSRPPQLCGSSHSDGTTFS